MMFKNKTGFCKKKKKKASEYTLGMRKPRIKFNCNGGNSMSGVRLWTGFMTFCFSSND